MSITAYKIESVGHARTGKDYGYVNIITATATSGPVPSLINAKDGSHVGGRERLWAPCSRQQGG